ncbi:MAG: chromosomal replication initiator protein DnaA [Acidimicrobiia bacterium]
MDNALNAAAQALWAQCAAPLRHHLGEATWRTWLDGVDGIELDAGVLVLGVPNALARQRIESAYLTLIEATLGQVAGERLTVDLLVQTEPRADHMVEPPSVLPDNPRGAAVPIAEPAGEDRFNASGHALNPRYSFDQFVIGPSNRFAHAATLSVAEKPGESYNPLFIYGPSGLGKTHLLHAVGHHVHQLYPFKRVRYVSTETFMNEFVEMIRRQTQKEFKRYYREVDVLLIDDMQFMLNSERLQEEFFHTFDSLHGTGGQIVISSDRPLKAMTALEDRLRTRIGWGLLTDISPPEFETRLAILRHKARAQNLREIPDEVLSFIATHVADNVRELEGALIRVAAYSSLSQTPATEDLAREVLVDVLAGTPTRVLTPQIILEETAKMFGWTVEELCGRSRRRPLVTARQIGMYVFRELTDYSYPQIAREFGGRDHTTVMYAVEKITLQIAERRVTYDQVSELINRIKSGDA